MDNIKYCNNCLVDAKIKYNCSLPNCEYNICATCYNTSYSLCMLTNKWYCNVHIHNHNMKKYINQNLYSYWT